MWGLQKSKNRKKVVKNRQKNSLEILIHSLRSLESFRALFSILSVKFYPFSKIGRRKVLTHMSLHYLSKLEKWGGKLHFLPFFFLPGVSHCVRGFAEVTTVGVFNAEELLHHLGLVCNLMSSIAGVADKFRHPRWRHWRTTNATVAGWHCRSGIWKQLVFTWTFTLVQSRFCIWNVIKFLRIRSWFVLVYDPMF